jgi:hypothetical protein
VTKSQRTAILYLAWVNKGMMSTRPEPSSEQRISRARDALQRARDLRISRRTRGVNGIRQFVKDVDGDWLNDWTDTTVIPTSDHSTEVFIFKLIFCTSVLSILFFSVINPDQTPCLDTKIKDLASS